jgi:hypothetical protein
MRALGYFVADPNAPGSDPTAEVYQQAQFLQYCSQQHHFASGSFTDAVTGETAFSIG